MVLTWRFALARVANEAGADSDAALTVFLEHGYDGDHRFGRANAPALPRRPSTVSSVGKEGLFEALVSEYASASSRASPTLTWHHPMAAPP